jgi:hypothetical protein
VPATGPAAVGLDPNLRSPRSRRRRSRGADAALLDSLRLPGAASGHRAGAVLLVPGRAGRAYRERDRRWHDAGASSTGVEQSAAAGAGRPSTPAVKVAATTRCRPALLRELSARSGAQ